MLAIILYEHLASSIEHPEMISSLIASVLICAAKQMMKVWVIIPAYNESLKLEMVLDELRKYDVSILVIDDGSEDNTHDIACKNSARVIRNDVNLGKGMSLNKGISYLIENEKFDYIVTMDADGQHSPLDMGLFLEEAGNSEAFVIGNRMHNHTGMPLKRVITNKFMSWFISRIVGQSIPDTQCCLRLIKREVLERIIIQTKKFEIESEILIKAARLGFKIKSIPIKSIYYKNLRSKIQPFLDTLRFIRFVSQLDRKNP